MCAGMCIGYTRGEERQNYTDLQVSNAICLRVLFVWHLNAHLLTFVL